VEDYAVEKPEIVAELQALHEKWERGVVAISPQK
jgi:hypothetical protein